ncbi:MAG: hypothetical protein WD669_07420 [Pirellulales bacterium]
MRKLCLPLVAAVVLSLSTARPAAAIQQFFNAFVDNYVKNHPDKKFAEMVQKEAKCLVCHQGAKNRKNRNMFGKEMDKLLDRQKDMKDVEKIVASLKTALAVRTDPKNDKSETFLDRVKAGKLPGGNLEDLKKEPPEGAAK